MASNSDIGHYIGLMSGTSLDGVDGVVLDNSGNKILAQVYIQFSTELRESLLELTQNSQTSLKNLINIDIEVANHFAKAALQLLDMLKISSQDVVAIGSHGQSVFHQGGKYSMQIGHGAIIAEQTKITTVSDFRMQDVAAGGQGAPLTPLYHQHLLNGKDGIVINLGGIANITKAQNGKIIGFDSGPANTLLDNWIKKSKNLEYDRDGVWARSGFVDEVLLEKLLNDDYFHKEHPKSTGPEYFNLGWLSKYLEGNEADADVARTLIELTVMSVSAHISNEADVYLCGGGVHNLFLFERLEYQNPNNNIMLTNDLGVHVDYVEAAAFGFFAKQTLAGLPSNLPEVTGAKGLRVLGAVYAI